jgi:hypothetical protein
MEIIGLIVYWLVGIVVIAAIVLYFNGQINATALFLAIIGGPLFPLVLVMMGITWLIVKGLDCVVFKWPKG